MSFQPWPHQQAAFDATMAALNAGHRRICIQSPTGMGKTKLSAMLVKKWLEQGERCVLYTNRRLLLEQSSDVFSDFDIYHGVRAAGHKGSDMELSFQISSIQTETSRVNKKKTWTLHDARYVLIDEAHVQTGPEVQKIVNQHLDDGAVLLGFTATPLDLGGMYQHLIQAGTLAEGRQCGALVLAHHYGPDEPDLKALKVKPQEGKDLSENQIRQVMMNPTLFGRVWEWFEKLNPDHLPTLLFAPGVRESIWFCEQFALKGVKTAHIDGEIIWIDGEQHRTTNALRQQVLDGSKAGDIHVLCNRFVLREGIDCPWLRHIIAATIFGSLQTYIQSLNRGGRADRDPETIARFGPKTHYTVQDHGGNWWRHGSLNADRVWSLAHTASIAYGLRADKLRKREEKKPRRCPECGRIATFYRCPCGFEFFGKKTAKPVITAAGECRMMEDDCFKARRIVKMDPDNMGWWDKCLADWKLEYCKAKSYKKGRTFRQAFALFSLDHYNQYPDPTWPFMPKDDFDSYLLVKDVPRERLY